MFIFSLDTALGGLGVCVSRDGEPVASFADPSLADQAALLVPTIERVMAEAGVAYHDLGGIAVTLGPGGFTGVRIGLATARALAFAAGKPLRGFTTLEVLAEACIDRPMIAALPAGRGMFYVQAFLQPHAPYDPRPEPVEGWRHGTAFAKLPAFDGLRMRAEAGRLTGQGEACGDSPAMLLEAEVFARAEQVPLVCTPGQWLDRMPASIRFIPHDIAANAKLLARLAHRRGFAGTLAEPLPLYIRPPDAKPQASLLANIIAS